MLAENRRCQHCLGAAWGFNGVAAVVSHCIDQLPCMWKCCNLSRPACVCVLPTFQCVCQSCCLPCLKRGYHSCVLQTLQTPDVHDIMQCVDALCMLQHGCSISCYWATGLPCVVLQAARTAARRVALFVQMNKQLCQYAAGYATQHISMRRLTDMFDFWQGGLARAC